MTARIIRAMRVACALFVLGLVACSFARAGAAEAGFSDKICPEATQYVLAVGKLRKDDPPQTVYDASQAAATAYARCSKDKLSNGFREAQHYADTRGGQFVVLAARALIALNRADEARQMLQQQRPLVQQVVDWQAETQTANQGHSPGTRGEPSAPAESGNTMSGDKRPSMYRAAAKDVVAAIDAELAAIDTRSRELGRPQAPQPSPGH